jgi:hypothetical protein
LTGSIRSECLDHIIIVFGEALLRALRLAGYYNELRTHLSLSKDPPCQRSAQRLGQLILSQASADFIINIVRFSFW